MSGEHAPLQPSSASRWVQCAASVRMEAMFAEEETEASREGTLAHEVAANLLRGKDTVHPDVTEDMRDGAEMLFDSVSQVRSRLNSSATLRIEERVNCPTIHPHCWGTPDVRLLDVALNELHVWDYKFGHRYVDPFENQQLMAYAIGALDNYGTATTQSIKVTLHIVQPRNYHPSGPVRERTLFGSELLGKYHEVLRVQAAKAMSQQVEPEAVVGPECIDCKARRSCTTLIESSYSVVQIARAGRLTNMTPDAMGRELTTLSEAQDILKARISGLEAEVLQSMRAGAPVRGYIMQQGMGRQKWTKPAEEVLALGQMMAIDVSKPGVVTPKQAIKAGIPEAVVVSYSETPMGEMKLVRDNGVQARRVFNSN